MAMNVFLVFWRGYDAVQLRHLEKWYLLLAYGLPVIPPLVYVILDHVRPMPILGPATVRQPVLLYQNCANCVALVLGRKRS